MIEGLKPYPQYKDSGDPFIGEIPSGWSSFPISQVARLKTVTNQTNRELLSVYLNRGVVKFSEVSEKRTNVTSEDLSKYQAVDPGDLVLNNQQAWRGSVGVSNYRGIVSPAYLVLTLSSKYDSKYANILFRDRSLVAQYLVCSKGVGTIQRNLYWPHLKRVSAIIPPPDEQAAIVKFLDYANAKIERAIRAKRKLIALLNEQKQAIIHTAISGVSTQDCRMMPVRAVLHPVKRMGYPNETLLSLFRDYGVIPKDSRENKNVDVRDLALCQLVNPGDVVMNKMKAWQGSIAVSDLQGIVSPDYMVLEFQIKPIVKEFFHYALRSPSMVANYRKQAYGVRPGQWRLMYPDFCRLRLPVPTIEKQLSTVQQIKSDTQSIYTAIVRSEREIALLREYRTTLTAEVVTGKLDVREAAKRLPDHVDEPLPPDDSMDEMIEDEIDQEDDA